MRSGLAVLVALAFASCGVRDSGTRPKTHGSSSVPPDELAKDAPAPGLRLPTTVQPLAYDVRLELDPESETFRGRAEIRATIATPVDHVWLHLVDLEIASAQFRAGSARAAEPLQVSGNREEMRAFSFGRVLPRGEVTLVFEYSGQTSTDDTEGMFRQLKGRPTKADWFLFSQAQSTFARRILPCFDEPALKAVWRTTLVVPKRQVALANAPMVREVSRGDGRKEVQFAAIGPMSTYLFAVAVGPFELVDGGRVGRAQIPLRVAVAPGDSKRAAPAIAWTPKLVTTLETYLDHPLPLQKLDLVAVPRFFGAMENAGLVLFEDDILLGDRRDPAFVRKLVRFVAHELAHQWFGNSVTPAWWNDLWISEAFATLFDDKLSSAVGTPEEALLRTQLARAEALVADRASEARPIRGAINATDDIEAAFDAISYEKGAAVLAMIEELVGEAAFRDVLRAFVRDHAGRAVTAADFIASLSRTTTGSIGGGALGDALLAYLDRQGAPVVDFATSCTAIAGASAAPTPTPPTVSVTPRGGIAVPVCIRYPTATATNRRCTLAKGRTLLALDGSTSCPRWIATNANGRGYYHANGLPLGELAPLTIAERIALGHDLAAAVARGEVAAAQALSEIEAFVALRDPHAQLAAIAMFRELVWIADDERAHASVARWFATRIPERLTKPAIFGARTPLEIALRDAVLEAMPATAMSSAAIAHARELVDRSLASPGANLYRTAFALAAPAGGKPLFERVVAAARGADGERREFLLEMLGNFDARFAGRVVELALQRDIEALDVWSAIEAMFQRVETRSATWQAVRDRLPRLLGELAPTDAGAVIRATATLCDATVRQEVATRFAAHAAAISEGPALLARSLAAIDRCIARRTKIGSIGGALAP